MVEDDGVYSEGIGESKSVAVGDGPLEITWEELTTNVKWRCPYRPMCCTGAGRGNCSDMCEHLTDRKSEVLIFNATVTDVPIEICSREVTVDTAERQEVPIKKREIRELFDALIKYIEENCELPDMNWGIDSFVEYDNLREFILEKRKELLEE